MQSKILTFAELDVVVKLLSEREKVITWLTAANPLNRPLEVSMETALVEPEAIANTPDEQPKLDQEVSESTAENS